MTQSAERDRCTVTDIYTEKKSHYGIYICTNKKSHLSHAPFVSLSKETTVPQMHRYRAINPEMDLKAQFGTLFTSTLGTPQA